MKLQALLFSLALSLVHAEPALETIKDRSFTLPSIKALRFAASAGDRDQLCSNTVGHGPSSTSCASDSGPFFLDPKLQPLLRESQPGEVVGRVELASQLDKHRSLARLKLGARAWDVSLAGDAGFSRYFLALRDGQELRFAPIGDLNRLRREGLDIQVEPGVVYNFHLAINIFSPVRGSTLEIRPARGSSGPSYGLKTGALLDAVRDRSLVFNADGAEYWALYGTDVDPAAGRQAATRSFLFIHMDGLSSKAWPVAEAALPLDRPYRAELKTSVALTRSASELLVSKPR